MVKRDNRVPRAAAIALLTASCLSRAIGADEVTLTPVLPDALVWFAPPGSKALQGAWVIGAEDDARPYLLRVKLAQGGRIPPHTHPDERNSTVLSGTLYVGFGETFDEAKVVAIPAGGVYVAPARVPHYVWAKDGDVVYQEAGVGPTRTVPVKR